MVVEPGMDDRNVFVISFPRSGRTWIRVMLSRYKQLLLGLERFEVELHALGEHKGVPTPRFLFHHANAGAWPIRTPKEWLQVLAGRRRMKRTQFSLKTYHGVRVTDSPMIFLIRDPRAVVVSHYYFCVLRTRCFHGTLSAFIRDKDIGIRKIVHFMNFIAEQRHNFQHLVVFYEDLHRQTKGELERMVRFAGLEVTETHLSDSVAFASFDHMRQLEESGEYGPRLTPGDVAIPNSYKVREGQIDSYHKELSVEDVRFLDRIIDENLDGWYQRYRHAVATACS